MKILCTQVWSCLLYTSIGAGFSGGEIVRLLEERGCETDFVRMPQGHSRINVKVCAPDGEERCV